ncbi:MAG: DndE family protein [Candidatus Paceibacterota bacterium]
MATLNKLYISEDTDKKLRVLKSRTGLTPNLLIRYGMAFSLEEDGMPDQSLYGDDQFREFNRYTLTGPWDLYFTALVKERILEDDLDPERDFELQFKAHIARGVHLIYQRLKSLEDIGDMIEHVQKRMKLHSNSMDATIDELVDE